MIGCLQSGQAFVIDPKRDIEDYLKTADENGLKITGILDTHIHADHISGGALVYSVIGGMMAWEEVYEVEP